MGKPTSLNGLFKALAPPTVACPPFLPPASLSHRAAAGRLRRTAHSGPLPRSALGGPHPRQRRAGAGSPPSPSRPPRRAHPSIGPPLLRGGLNIGRQGGGGGLGPPTPRPPQLGPSAAAFEALPRRSGPPVEGCCVGLAGAGGLWPTFREAHARTAPARQAFGQAAARSGAHVP